MAGVVVRFLYYFQYLSFLLENIYFWRLLVAVTNQRHTRLFPFSLLCILTLEFFTFILVQLFEETGWSTSYRHCKDINLLASESYELQVWFHTPTRSNIDI